MIRERYSIPTLEDITHELSNSKYFTKVDLSSGYWHIKLDKKSSFLTTFQINFGRFRWLRLPFGLSVSSEIFQKKLLEAITGLKGIVCIADDIVIHGATENEHDQNLSNLIKRCEMKNIKLNKSKLRYKVRSLTFMGHKISDKGLEVDPEKVEAIKRYPTPTNVSQLKFFLGMVNFLAKFLPRISDVLQPLNNLLKKEVHWNWSQSQASAFKDAKEVICKAANLVFYNPEKEVLLENDASDYGLGSVLLQEGKPIAYASRTLNDAERNYS